MTAADTRIPRATNSATRATGELACRPGSVHPLSRAGGHPSRAAVAGSLVRSTRGLRRAALKRPRRHDIALRHHALLTLLRVGFTKPPQSPAALVVSYTTVSPLPPAWHARSDGGLFSVALSRGSPRVGVTDHPALRSPDLPRRSRRTGTDATARPACPPLPEIVSPAARFRRCHRFRARCRSPATSRSAPQRRLLRCAVSFSVRKTADPLSKQSMWHSEATSRFILNIASGGASSARHTRVLIGVTWLTTIVVWCW